MSNKFIDMEEDISDFIQNIVNTSKLLDMESVVFDSESVRGKGGGEGGGILIIQDNDLPELPFDGIAFGDIVSLGKRLRAFDDPKFQYMVKEKESGYTYPYKIRMKTKGTMIEYVCLNPSQVKAPKRLKDPTHFSFMMDTKSVKLLSESKGLMMSDSIVLSGKDSKVKFEVSDLSSATMTHTISKNLICIEEDEHPTFVHPYKFSNIVNVFKYMAKQSDEFEVCVTRRGFLSIEVNGLNIHILREVN